jgi:hypothetical protein
VPAWQRRFLVATAAIVGYSVGYVLCDFGGFSKLTYEPVERVWHFTDRPTPLSMQYLGIVLWGVCGALVAGGLAYGATRLVDREVSGQVNTLAGAWALTAFGYAGLYYTWGLWPF